MRHFLATLGIVSCLFAGAAAATAQDVDEDGAPDLFLTSAMEVTFTDNMAFRFENRSDEDGFIDDLRILKGSEQVRTLHYTEEDGDVGPGERHDFTWDLKNNSGQVASAGTYEIILVWISMKNDLIYTLKRDFEIQTPPATGRRVRLVAAKSHFAPGETVRIKLLTLDVSRVTLRYWRVGYELSNDSENVLTDTSVAGTILRRRQEKLFEWRPVDAQGRPLKSGQYGITVEYSFRHRGREQNAATYETVRILNW